jgi:fatty-acyl-CoA synthase
VAQLTTDALAWWVRANPERPAFVVGDETLTYGELGAWTDRAARHLREHHGITTGDVVALAGTNSLEWCVAALAVIKAGAILTPVNFRYTVPEITYLVQDCTPVLALVDESQAPKFAELAATVAAAPVVVPLASLRNHQHGPATPLRIDADTEDPIVIAYTSGTTGRPKGLVYSHGTVLASLFELLLKDPSPPERTALLLGLPLFSVAGIVHTVLHMTSRGATAVVMKDLDPGQALRLLHHHQISHMNGVPVIWEMMAADPSFETLDLSHLEVAMVGGARVSQELLAAWQRRGVALRHMYGMTEVGGCGTVPRPPDALAHPELCGDGSIFTEVKTVRRDGTDCDPGEEGEIVMRGPGTMLGYWKNPEGTAEVLRHGWVHSGDLGVVDENGYLRFVDRLKDIIISGGFNVSPSEVEAVIATVPGVSEVAVIAAPDAQWGETPAAIVHGTNVDPAAIVAAARAELAVFKVPSYVVTSETPLPRMASGKIAKRQLREQYPDIPAIAIKL